MNLITESEFVSKFLFGKLNYQANYKKHSGTY